MGESPGNKFETSVQFHPLPTIQNGGAQFASKHATGKAFMCKLDLKDTYFGVPLKRESRKYVRFQWEGTLYEFLCLCFGLGPASLIFTKILKIPILLLKRLQIRVIIYLDDMLLMSQTIEELLISRD